LLEPLDAALQKVAETWSEAKSRGKINETFFLGSSFGEVSVAAIAKRVERALDAPDQLGIWTARLLAHQECFDSALGGIVEAFAGQPYEAPRLSVAIDRVFWRTLARTVLAEHPAIGRYTGLQVEKARERFQRLDEEILQLQREALAAQLCRRPIDPGYKADYRKYDTRLVLVRNEIGKQKRHIPIRALPDRASRSIQQMKPCFMMSPVSVAQFLKA
jgi:hypothetical protein